MIDTSGDQIVSAILRPTLHDNDFLQSFVRIGLEESSSDTKRSQFHFSGKKKLSSASKSSADGSRSSQDHYSSKIYSKKPKDSKKLDSSDSKIDGKPGILKKRSQKGSISTEIIEEKTKKGRKRRSASTRRLEEVYIDKDRAAAVNLGTRDIIQSLKIKRKQDRSRMMQIPEEAEPSSMLALGNREMKIGDLNIAISCINKALELSPNDKNALLARSKCYLMLGEAQKALEDAETALNEKGNEKVKESISSRAIYYKAEALYHLGDFELSLVYYYRGMRLRPEFDQFRLGVQKAKEAIQNILGNNKIPIRINHSHPDELTNKRTLETEEKLENNNNIIPISDNQMKKKEVEENKKKELSNGSSHLNKNKSVNQNLLGQLSVDKKYLQQLLTRSEVKAANQPSATHITKHAEEGVSFLKNRQNFWRQQQPNPDCSLNTFSDRVSNHQNI